MVLYLQDFRGWGSSGFSTLCLATFNRPPLLRRGGSLRISPGAGSRATTEALAVCCCVFCCDCSFSQFSAYGFYHYRCSWPSSMPSTLLGTKHQVKTQNIFSRFPIRPVSNFLQSRSLQQLALTSFHGEGFPKSGGSFLGPL